MTRCPICAGIGTLYAQGINDLVVIECPECAGGIGIVPASADDHLATKVRVRNRSRSGPRAKPRKKEAAA